jgi:hypothetical protein
MGFAKEAFHTVSKPADKVTALHIDVVASYYYFAMTSRNMTSSERWRAGKVEAQLLLRRCFAMPELLISLKAGTPVFGSGKNRNNFLAAIAGLSHEVFMMKPLSENIKLVNGGHNGHPEAPVGFDQAAEDLFFSGNLPITFNLGHLLRQEVCFKELIGHQRNINCCALFGCAIVHCETQSAKINYVCSFLKERDKIIVVKQRWRLDLGPRKSRQCERGWGVAGVAVGELLRCRESGLGHSWEHCFRGVGRRVRRQTVEGLEPKHMGVAQRAPRPQ